MNAPKSELTPEEIEEFKARRRRERWNAFMTPFITLTSIVVSISLLMYFIKSCNERYPQNPAARRLPIQRMPEPPPPAPK
jgi:hypothetical protein